jgi:NAD(P)-dependent dehydrogenase (short-subunit alcohol dehydrogenase family)
MYTAVKAAVRDLTFGFSVELLPRRIRVNTISPGMIDTPIIMREGAPAGVTPEQMAAAITQTIPVRRRGSAEEIARAVLFLASDDSSYCFGSELLADGGLTHLVPA